MDREGQNEQHAQPERGRRDGRDGKDADGLVGPAVAVKCRDHAKDQGNGDADEQPEEGKLERHGECFGDSCAHGCAVGAVIAEVSLGEEIPKERTVTDEEWIVEAVAFAVFLQRPLGRAFAKGRVGLIDLGEGHEEEHEERHAENHDRQRDEAPSDKSQEIVHEDLLVVSADREHG